MALLAAVLATVAAVGALPATPAPGLRLADRDPLTLIGARFGIRESVRVEVRAGSTVAVKTVRAGLRGTFTVVFPILHVSRSTDLDVTAVGARGHRAAFQLRHTVGGERV